MDFIAITGFLSSIVTIEEGGRAWFPIIRKFLAKRKINLRNWDSDDALVQYMLDAFKSDEMSEYREHEFSAKEIEEIGEVFLKQERFRGISYEDGKEIKAYIADILNRYNEYTQSQMSPGERVILDKVDQEAGEIKELLKNPAHGAIFEKFAHVVDECKNIDIKNIESLIKDEYEIDRSGEVEYIKKSSGRFICILGHAGYGKSVLAKKLVENEDYVLYTRADRLIRFNDIDEIWGCDLRNVIQEPDIAELYLFIDALEYIADCDDQSGMHILERLYYFAEQHAKVYILTTCRTVDKNAFIKLFSNYGVKGYVLSGLSTDEISKLNEKYSIISKLSEKKEYRRLLESPFYINLIVSNISDIQGDINEYEIRERVWQEVICMKKSAGGYGISSKDIRDCVINIALKRAQEYVLGVLCDEFNENVIKALVSEGVLEEKNGRVRLKYDIYEDICFEHIIDGYYADSKGNKEVFFHRLETIGRSVYRRFQIWISNKLLIEQIKDKLLHDLAFDDGAPKKWRNQTYIGITKSDYSSVFFKSYFDDLIYKHRFAEFVRIINLYSFDISTELFGEIFNDVKVTPNGVARGSVIKLLDDNAVGVSELSPESILKLCIDYSLQMDDDADARRSAVGLIEGYIDRVENPIPLYHIRYRLADVDGEWNRTILYNLKSDLYNEDRTKRRSAEKTIDDILRRPEDKQVRLFSKEICDLADAYWRLPEREGDDRFSFVLGFSSGIEGVETYGLSRNADYHSHNTKWFDYSFLLKVLSVDFETGFSWCIDFINYAIDKYAASSDNDLFEVHIYYHEDGIERTYFGSHRLWLAGVDEQTIPTIIGDILYTLKTFLISDFTREINAGNKEYERIYYVRDRIYKESHNVGLLQIIEEIGLHFSIELKGYAIDLCSSLELLFLDDRRQALYDNSPLRDLLKNQVLQAVNMPFLNQKRYNLDKKCGMGLQEYAIRTQFYYDDLKQQCYDICDYLYKYASQQNYSDDDLKLSLLHIEKMDLRKYDVIDRGDGAFEIHGKHDEETFSFGERGNDSTSDRDTEQTQKEIDKVKKSINDLQEEYNTAKKTLEMLKDKGLSVAQRDELCRNWADGLNRLFSNGTFPSDNKDVDVLFNQLDEDIFDDTKELIASFIIRCLGYNDNNGIITNIAYSVQKFLEKNQNWALKVFYAQLYIAEKGGADIEQSARKYIVGDDAYDFDDVDIASFDLPLLCDVSICGLSIENEQYANVMDYILSSYEKLADRESKYRRYDYSLQVKVATGFRRELINSNKAVDLLIYKLVYFDSKGMNDDIQALFQDIFFHMSAIYFDGQTDRLVRLKIEERLGYIGEKITTIGNHQAEDILYKALILHMPRYSGDWSGANIKAEYSYEDKMFLGKQFSQYGKYDPASMLRTIYNFHIEKLVPEILPSINTALSDVSEEDMKMVAVDSDATFVLERIICYAFLNCSKEIKWRVEYADAFEDILELMVKWENPKAAVILDEFRLH